MVHDIYPPAARGSTRGTGRGSAGLGTSPGRHYNAPVPSCPACQADVPAGSRFCPSCGAAALATAAMESDPWLGQVVNRKFRIQALIGQGGMGRVYKAMHLTLDRPVVLKMLHRGLTSDPSVVQRFHREAKAASRLVNPHSIQVLDFGEAEDGTLFMAMEYLGGKDLAHLLATGGPLPEARIVRIGAQILEALGEAHAHGIIHRDLKPENVMVEDRRNDADHVTVLDFGIAKISDPGPEDGKLTQAGLVCGTPQYMSPEQARGRDLDPRTDLYSTGVILYQMATGKLPFESDTPVGFLTKHIAEPPAPMRERNPELSISAPLEALIARALAKERQDRPASADAMRADLLACLAPAAPAPSPTRLQGGARPAEPERKQPAPDRRSPVVPIAIALLVVGAGVGGWVAMRGTPTPAPAAIEAPAATATSAPPPTVAPTATPPPSPDPASAARPTATPGAAPTPAALPPRPARDAQKARALFDRAEARRREMDAVGAIALYLEAEKADPQLADLHKKLGQCYQLLGDIPRARERYQKYLASGPADADAVRSALDLLR